MKKVLAIVSLSAMLLVGCSQTATPEGSGMVEIPSASETFSADTAPTAEATPEPSASPEGEKSKRGLYIKDVGDTVGVVGYFSGTEVAQFTVDAIEVDPVCTGEWAEASENGHFLVLDISVATNAELAEESPATLDTLNPYGMKVVADNGTTSNVDMRTMAAMDCLDEAETLPSGIGPGENVTGKIVLDVETPTGTLLIKDALTNGGWEFKY